MYEKYKSHETFTSKPFFNNNKKGGNKIIYPTVDELRKVLKLDELKEKVEKI